MRIINWLAWQIYLLRHWPARLRMRRRRQRNPLFDPAMIRPGRAVGISLPTALSPEVIKDFLRYYDDPRNFERVTEKLRKIFQGQESGSGSDQK